MLLARRDQTGAALECVRRALDLQRSFDRTHPTDYQIACAYAPLFGVDPRGLGTGGEIR